MVLGLGTKPRKSPSVQVEYRIHLQEIKPWPPSQSLRSLRSALIQWEHGDKHSGSTNTVIPSLVSGSGVGDGKIDFNESFRLPVTLLREMSIKGGNGDTFQKNCIEFNLYEPRRDKTVKGQLLATAIVDLADYGIVQDTLSISAPMNCKRTFGNTSQPVLFLKIQPVERTRSRRLSRDNLLREESMERNTFESVSALMNEEYAEEAETTSCTDDDVSSHSSIAVSSSAFESNGGSTPQKEQNGSEAMKVNLIAVTDERRTKPDMKPASGPESMMDSSSFSSSVDSSTYLGSPEHVRTTLSNIQEPSFTTIPKIAGAHSVQSSLSSIAYDGTDDELTTNKRINDHVNGERDITFSTREMSSGLSANLSNCNTESQVDEKLVFLKSIGPRAHELDNETAITEGLEDDRLKSLKSVRSSMDLGRSNGSVRTSKFVEKVKDVALRAETCARSPSSNEGKDAKVYPKETRTFLSDSKVQHLEQRVKMLEGELREAAAIEVGLYSVVAEHGSSSNKVHAPARRLSRLYLHACKENSQLKRASAARSAVSGLVLVAKACGNDVPRLTFWLSNSVVLRAIVTQASELPLNQTGDGKGNNEKSSPLKWKESPSGKERRSAPCGSLNEWEDPRTFTLALEKIEAWIFSRIVESVWWQTLTPYMQSAAARAIVRVVGSESSKVCQRTSSSRDQEQANFSAELWKTAFMDACERICPVRAGGHECGCLPVLSRLVMEQCMSRLDVAMFNAILRESDDEVPTDPVSDPISDARVLPIPAGSASFGAGAQLKNAIGNWSRWLTDLFGIDDDCSIEDENEHDNYDDSERKESFKAFHLLNALSDLMMLPKDMLLSSSIRKEVCPIFGAPLIKRILDTFVPDEFCPDPIPKVVLEALDLEDHFESSEDCFTNIPSAAAPVVYLPPSASSIARIFGDGRSQTQLTRTVSTVLRKSYTSDDELEELDSPLTSIIDSIRASASPSNSSWTLKENSNRNAVRYQLLRDVWMNSD